MKYTIEGFSQEYALMLTKQVEEKGKLKTVKVDCIDLIILRWFVDFYPRMAKVEIEGVQYAWLNYKKLLDDMPLLDIGKHMLANRLQKLCEFGILTHKNVKYGGSFSYYGFGTNYHNLIEKSSATDEHLVQNNAEPYAINCTTLVQNNAEPYAINCNTNNSSTKDPSIKDPSIKDAFVKKESKPKSGYEKIIAEYTMNDELKEAIFEFIKMRKLIKKPMTDRALKAIFNKLDKLGRSDGEKIAILDQSIQNSWQGVFELKEPYEEPEQHREIDWDNLPF